MGFLDDFRTANPAYKDVDDGALADALYNKYYSSMPRADFDAKLGAKSAAAPAQTTAPQPERQTFIGPRDRDTSEWLSDNTGMSPGYWRRVLYDFKAPGRYIQNAELPFEGTVQAIPHALSYLSSAGGYAPNALSRFWGDTAGTVDENARRREEEYQTERTNAGVEPGSTDYSRLIGTAISPMTVATGQLLAPAEGANLLGKLWAAARTGAAIGAEQPVYGDNYGREKAWQAGTGAVAGTATQGLASLVGPWVSADASRLMGEYGVNKLTTGQLSTIPSMNRVEEITQSAPLSGLVVGSARNTADESLNRAVANRILQPIGERLDPNTDVGRDAMAEVNRKISDEFNRVVPNLRGQNDAQFQQDVAAIRARLPDRASLRADFDEAVRRNVTDRFDSSGQMVGREAQGSFADLRDEARNLIQGNSTAEQRTLGFALNDVRDAMGDMWTRNSAPEDIAAYQAVRNAFAEARVMERASSYVGAESGVFNANQFLSAVKATDDSLRDRAFTEGQARLQDFAELAKRVMGNKVPDSGTPIRMMLNTAIHGGGGGAEAFLGGPGAWATSGLHALSYSPLGQWVLRGAASGLDNLTVGQGTNIGRSALQTSIQELTPGVSALVAYSSGAKSMKQWIEEHQNKLSKAMQYDNYYGTGQ